MKHPDRNVALGRCGKCGTRTASLWRRALDDDALCHDCFSASVRKDDDAESEALRAYDAAVERAYNRLQRDGLRLNGGCR